ncbi:MAG: hypothetical protein GY841_06595 [FCB group bacterium]|nr:hypothetical protein [FCB group bacterium]
MKYILRTLTIIPLLAALLMALLPAAAVSASFTADLVEREGNQVKTGRLYATDTQYRLDVTMGDEKFIVIVDKKSEMTRVLRIKQKQYVEVKSSDRVSLMNDPFQGLKFAADHYGSKVDGIDTISGYLCDRRIIVDQEKTVMTFWQSSKLNFPLKIVVDAIGNKRLELKHVREEAIADSLFLIPDGFTKMVDPKNIPVPIPDWSGEISSAPVLTPPFERNFTEGDIVRIKVTVGNSIWVKSVGSDSTTVARAIPFKEGKPLKRETYYNNFAKPGTICSRRHETTEEADEIVLRVYKGITRITAKYSEMREKVISAGEELRVPLSTSKNIEIRFVNVGEESAAFGWNYFREGELLNDNVVGPVRFRTQKLSKTGDLHNSTFRAYGDEFVVAVARGKVLVKVGQFDTFKF